MSVDKYLFWSGIQQVVNNLNNLTDYNEEIWTKNFLFKENLNVNLRFVDTLLENDLKNKIKR